MPVLTYKSKLKNKTASFTISTTSPLVFSPLQGSWSSPSCNTPKEAEKRAQLYAIAIAAIIYDSENHINNFTLHKAISSGGYKLAVKVNPQKIQSFSMFEILLPHASTEAQANNDAIKIMQATYADTAAEYGTALSAFLMDEMHPGWPDWAIALHNRLTL